MTLIELIFIVLYILGAICVGKIFGATYGVGFGILAGVITIALIFLLTGALHKLGELNGRSKNQDDRIS